MSYISFYRKWRPQTFSEVIGQEHIVKTLQNAISKNRLVHGYMFCGPKGTGKTSIARIFAKAVNCANGPAMEPCNKCDNCISITAGTNVDIIEIDGASNGGIDHIRDLREKIKFLPIFLRKKVYIIDEAHQVTREAFNALLKTLEEPPEHIMFIMATTAPEKVMQTIMSRCQRFDFEPISLEGLRYRLKEIAASESIDITDSALSMVAKYSDGSLRDAEGILEQLSSFGDNRITVDEVSSILGVIDQEMFFELANIILEKNISQSLLFISRLFSTSFSLKAFISEFTEHLYNLYIIKNYENPEDILEMTEEFKEIFYNQAGLFTSWKLECLIDLFSGLLSQIKDSENPKTFFKAAVIKALSTEEIKDTQVIKNLKRMDLDLTQFKNDIAELKTGSKIAGVVSTGRAVNIEIGDKERVVAAKIEREVPTQIEEVSIKELEKPEVIKKEKAGEDKAQEEKAEEDKARESKAEENKARESKAQEGKAGEEKVWEEKARESKSKEDMARESKAKSVSPGSTEKTGAVNAKMVEENLVNNIDLIKGDSLIENIMTTGGNVLENPGKDLPEELPQDLKKIPGQFLQFTPEIWEAVLVKTKVKSVPLHAVLKEVKKFKISENKILFYLDSKNRWHKTELNKLENREFIQKLLETLTGEKFEITFDFISDANVNESAELAHPARKTNAPAGSLPEQKVFSGSAAVLTDLSISKTDENVSKTDENVSKTDVDKNIIGNKEEDTYGYFENKFNVKEK